MKKRFGIDAAHANYKWWALSCTSLGMLLATINSGTLIIALPDLERALGTSLLELVWVILAYMIASTVLVLTAGRLSDLLAASGPTSAASWSSRSPRWAPASPTTATELILWRIAQGVGAAFLFANAAALVTDAFPSEQLGLAMGTNTMVAAVGLVLGPVLGGALVAISWHWVFWFNVPFALAGAAWGAPMLRELSRRDTERGLDLLGTVDVRHRADRPRARRVEGRHRGLERPVVIAGLIAGAVLLPLFVLIERHGARPDARPHDLPRTACSPPPAHAAFINGLSRFALLFVFVFSSRAPRSTRSRPGSSSRRWRSACSSPRRWRARGPTATARARWPPPACSSPPSGWRR